MDRMRRRRAPTSKPPKVLQEETNSQSDSDGVEEATEGTRQPPSLCQRFLHILKYVILILLIPPFLNYASLQQEAQKLQPDGQLYDIGFGQKLFFGCYGEGTPVVLLDAPTGMSSDVWTAVYPEIAKITKVCIYDRAGLGFSERPMRNMSASPDDDERKYGLSNDSEFDEEEEAPINPVNDRERWMEFTVERMADDLHRLMTYSSHQERPFIIVGSEIGALLARFYTQLYESDVSDLVLIDPLVENIFTQDNSVWSLFWFGHLMPSFQSMQVSAATGVTRLFLLLGIMEQPISGDYVPDDVINRQKYLLCNPRHLSSVVDEHYFINETFSQMNTIMKLKPFPSNVTVTVVTGNYYDEQLPSTLNKAWAKSQQDLISKLHPSSHHIVVNGGDHHMLYRKPQPIIEPIKRIVKQRRAQRNSQQR